MALSASVLYQACNDRGLKLFKGPNMQAPWVENRVGHKVGHRQGVSGQ